MQEDANLSETRSFYLIHAFGGPVQTLGCLRHLAATVQGEDNHKPDVDPDFQWSNPLWYPKLSVAAVPKLNVIRQVCRDELLQFNRPGSHSAVQPLAVFPKAAPCCSCPGLHHLRSASHSQTPQCCDPMSPSPFPASGNALPKATCRRLTPLPPHIVGHRRK